MKHSGIEWIGDIPKEWEVSRFKFVSKMYTGNSLNEQQKEKYSNSDFHETLPYIATKDVERDIERIDYDGGIRIPSSSDNFVVAPRNSVLLCIEGGSAGKKVGYTNQDVFFVNKLCCFTTDKNSRFLYYFILSHSFSEPFSQNLQGLIGGVSVSALKNFVISIPPLPEQQKIADYLDKVCGEVDDLVALQEQMIEELKAYKQSVITEAVTKGLNQNVPMRDSGIDWIGEIPEHWGGSRLKFYSVFINGFAFNSDVFTIDKGYKIIRIGDISQNLDFDGCVRANVETDSLQQYRIKDNDIVIAMSGATTGKCCVAKDVEEAYINQRVGIIRCSNYAYTYYQLQTDYFMEYIKLNNAGSAQPNVSGSSIGNFPILVPPESEQRSIASYLDTKSSEIDSLIALKQQKIEELKDYKKSVIYEYVTGKKEVV